MRVTDHRRPGYPFEKLRVWQQAHALTLTIYRLSANFPKDEQFGLTSQLRRVAPQYAGKPILNAQEIEDVLEFLVSLKP